MSEQAGEKSFAPSAKRRQDAAKRGDVLRSRELATAVVMLFGAAWLKFAGPWLMDGLDHGMRAGFTWDRAAIDDFAPGRLMLSLMAMALPPVLVLGGGVLAVSMISQLGVGDGRWVAANLAPKASRLNPMSGLKRMFGVNGWIEMVKGIGKVALLGSLAWYWSLDHVPGLIGLGRGTLSGQLAYGWDAVISLLFLLSGGLVAIALIDFPVQWLRRNNRLMMTQQEMRDEHKEAEGSPENKGAIKRRQREMAMAGVNQAMRQAQFVITNPTHFSVALAYDPALASAPVVLAKGRGDKALAMRELAAELGVPTLEYPALARSLYYTTRERQVIREELYVAVASVLAFVFSLKRGERPARPAVEVPTELRFDVEGRLDPAAAS